MTPIVNAMTVDVEDYFQVSAFESVVARANWDGFERRVAQNTDRLLDIFAEHNVHATFFVLGWVAEREPALVKRIAVAGHEIASHGYGHRLVYDQRPEEFREDVRKAKSVLEAATGQPVRGYRAPSFSITDRSLWALDILIEEGFAWDASIFPIRHDRYGIASARRHPFWVAHGAGSLVHERRRSSRSASDPRDVGRGFPGLSHAEGSPGTSDGLRLLEIPASTVRIAGVNLPVGGGGYFRLLPYGWTRWAISRRNSIERKPVVFYLHPWEIDPGQPRQPGIPWLSRFRHYRNLGCTEHRIRRLVAQFRFDSIAATVVSHAARRL